MLNMDQLSKLERDAVLAMRAAQAAAPAAPPGERPEEGERAWGEYPEPNPASVTRLIPPGDWVDKQIAGVESVGAANYSAGVTRPKRDPIKAGIDAQPAYEAAMRNPAVLARRVRGLQKTSIDIWAVQCETIGAARLVEGVTSRRPKIERAVGELHRRMLTHLSRIDAMPNVTPADRERRMVENLKGLRAMKDS